MKVKDIIKKIDDFGLYIELIDNDTGASVGFYKKNDPLLVYDNRRKNQTIKKINCQYIKGKRLLILYID